MTCLTSSLNNIAGKWLVILILVSGCFSSAQAVENGLGIGIPEAETSGPQMAGEKAILWTINVSGEDGPVMYRFILSDGENEKEVQAGSAAEWVWHPLREGEYRVRVEAVDSRGNTEKSEWSSIYVITSPMDSIRQVAILPVQNLSATRAPLNGIERKTHEIILGAGYQVFDDERLAEFLKKRRMRYTGGISSEIAKAMKDETGVDAVLVTSLLAYQEGGPPKFSLCCRLVTTGELPMVLWSDSIAFSGDEAPGLLDLGLIYDNERLQEKAIRFLGQSLASARHRHTKKSFSHLGKDQAKRYGPRNRFRSASLEENVGYTIAVIPFLNLSGRKYAEHIMGLNFINRLLQYDNIIVVDPGMVRDELLRTRSIMIGGPSLAVADFFFAMEYPEVDLILSGKVFDYQDIAGIPKVDFSVQIFEKNSRQIVWNSRSFNQGDEGVYFFDVGRVYTTQRLAVKMTSSVVQQIFQAHILSSTGREEVTQNNETGEL